MARVASLALWLAFAVGVVGCAKEGRAFRDLHYPMATRIVPVGNAEIAVHERGQGERTIVLIHGLGSYMPVWTHNLDALAREYRVIAIDLPGYGKSSKDNFTYSMRFFAQAVRAVIRQLGATRPVLVGHSMGGQIAMTYALQYPGEVEALVLSSPAGLEEFGDGEARWLSDAVTPTFTCVADPEAIFVRHAQNFYRMPKDSEFMVKDRIAVIGGPDFPDYCRAVSRSVSAMVDEPVLDRLDDIDVPVLVVFGAEDALLIPNPILHGGSTVRLAKKAVKSFPDAELVVLDKAGHMAQFEQWQQWNEVVLRFLGEHPDAPTPGVRKERTRKDGETFLPLFDDPPAHSHGPAATPTPPQQPAPDEDMPTITPDVPVPPPPAPDQPVAPVSPMTEEQPR